MNRLLAKLASPCVLALLATASAAQLPPPDPPWTPTPAPDPVLPAPSQVDPGEEVSVQVVIGDWDTQMYTQCTVYDTAWDWEILSVSNGGTASFGGDETAWGGLVALDYQAPDPYALPWESMVYLRATNDEPTYDGGDDDPVAMVVRFRSWGD